MDEIESILKRHKERTKVSNKVKDSKIISKTFSKILLGTIFILGSCIYIHLNNENINTYKKIFFEDNLTFAKFNNWYQNVFGKIIPTNTLNTKLVMQEDSLGKISNYLDGYQISVSKNSPISALESGILVYNDEKEGYGKTIIIQGIDGMDIWYGNVADSNLKLYDYVEEGSIIGNSIDDYYYNVFYKDGNKVEYDKYAQKVAN